MHTLTLTGLGKAVLNAVTLREVNFDCVHCNGTGCKACEWTGTTMRAVSSRGYVSGKS
jgi:hypothetical protein